MLEIDYAIERNESDKIVTYLPNQELKKIPNLSFIEGPNSSGKSTVLNILGLCFGGTKNELISKSLQEKMEALMDNSYQNLDYDIKIDTNDGILEISKNGSLYQASLLKNGNKLNLSADIIAKNYNLIYDIPEDPTARLSQLTQAIENNQKLLKLKVKNLKDYIRVQIIELSQSRNEEGIEKLNNKIIVNKQSIKELNDELFRITNDNEKLKNYTYTKLASKNLLEYNKLIAEFSEHKKIERFASTGKTSKGNSITRKKATKFLEAVEENSNLVIDDIINLFPNEFNFISEWKNYSYRNVYNEFEISKNICSIIVATQNSLISKKKAIDVKKGEIEKLQMIDSIIGVLKQTKSKELIVPGVNKNIDEFIVILEKESKPYKQIAKINDRIEEALELIKTILSDVDRLNNDILKNLKEEQGKEGPESNLMNLDEYKIKYDDLKKRMEKKKEAFDRNNFECTKLGIDLYNESHKQEALSRIHTHPKASNIRTTPTEDLIETIIETNNQIYDLSSEINKKNEIITRDLQTIKEMKSKEVHKYSGKEDKLNKTIMLLDKLLININNYNEYIYKIKKKEKNILNDGDFEFTNYNNLIGKYLGKVIGEVAYIDRHYKLNKVDIIKQELVTETGKIIRFKDMGTGQSQSTYLLGRLSNAASDERKIIVLFDEIAMMDSRSLKPIIEKMVELYEQGKLIVGIMVQRNEKGIIVQKLER